MFNKASGQVLVLGDNTGVIVTGTVKGDVIVYGAEQIRVDLHRPKISQPNSDNIAAMLTWQSRIPETLYGRDAEMGSLKKWAQSKSPLSVKLIYGEGGVGKTRLAFELADWLAEQPGWLAGQVAELGKVGRYPLGKMGTLLIIDYPEEQQNVVKRFCEQLNKMGEPKDSKLRILLLARRETPTPWPIHSTPIVTSR